MKTTALFILLALLLFCGGGFLGISAKLWYDSYSEWTLRAPIRCCSVLFFVMTMVIIWCMFKLWEVFSV